MRAHARNIRYGDWLRARQAGVERGRELFCRSRGGMLHGSDAGDAVVTDCTNQAAVTAAARINVYLGAEVNLVGDCLTNRSCGNIVTAVLPHASDSPPNRCVRDTDTF